MKPIRATMAVRIVPLLLLTLESAPLAAAHRVKLGSSTPKTENQHAGKTPAEKIVEMVTDGSPVGFSPPGRSSTGVDSQSGTPGGVASPQSWRYVSYYDRADKPSSEIFALTPEEGLTIPEMMNPDNLKPGQFVVRVDYVSLLPLARAHLEKAAHIRDTGAEEIGLKRTQLHEQAQGDQIATVVESKSATMPKGAQMWLSPFIGLQSHRILHDDGRDMIKAFGAPIPPMAFKLPEGISPKDYLAILTPGSGITAWMALNKGPMAEELNLKGWAGKKALVTSAAGGVGIVLVQLLLLKGCEVTGVTSTTEKAERLKDETGIHHTIAYKEEKHFDAALQKVGPFDIFIDNVGGWQLDAGIKAMAKLGQILMMGAISEHANYNMGKIRGIKEYLDFPAKELTMRGFMLTNHMGDNQANMDDARGALKERILKKKVRPVVTLKWYRKFSDFAEELDNMLCGDGFGRVVLEIWHEEDKRTPDFQSGEEASQFLANAVASLRVAVGDPELEVDPHFLSALDPNLNRPIRGPRMPLGHPVNSPAEVETGIAAVEALWNKRLTYYDEKNLDGYFQDVAHDIVLFWGSRTGKLGAIRTFTGETAVRGFVESMCGKHPYTHHLLNQKVRYITETDPEYEIRERGLIRIESDAKAAPAVPESVHKGKMPTIYGTFTGYYARRPEGVEGQRRYGWRLVKLLNWFE